MLAVDGRSEAISIARRIGIAWLRSRSAHPTQHTSAFSRRVSPEVCKNPIALKNKRAQGMPGACCTRGLVCNSAQKGAHEHTGTAGAFRHSLRSGFTAYVALSPETNSSCLRRRRIEGQRFPVGLRKTSGGLTPATGARTTRFCRPHPISFVWRAVFRSRNTIRPANILRARHCRGHRIPHPTSVTIAIRPSGGTGWPGF